MTGELWLHKEDNYFSDGKKDSYFYLSNHENLLSTYVKSGIGLNRVDKINLTFHQALHLSQGDLDNLPKQVLTNM